MDKRVLRLLIIEDNESDAALLERHLVRAGISLDMRRVHCQSALELALSERRWDFALSDYNLPGFNALLALELVRAADPDLPFIVVSGLVGEEAAVELMRAGAQDYVRKDHLSRLVPAMERELKEARAHRKQRRLSARLRAQDERLKLALAATGDGVWERNLSTDTVRFSAEWKAMLGYRASDIGRELSAWKALIHPKDLSAVEAALHSHRVGTTPTYMSEHRLRCKDGRWKWVLDRGVVISRDKNGAALREIGTMTDISAAKNAELLLRTSDEVLRKLGSQVPGMLYQFRLYPDGHSSLPFVSESVWELYAVQAQEVVHDAAAVFARVHPDDMPSLEQSIQHSAATLTGWKHEHRVITPSKGVRWLSGESQPERLPDGSTLWHGYIRDITERKEADAQLRLLQACINQVNDTIIVTEAEPLDYPGPRIVYVNAAFERQTGYSAAEAIGNSPRMLQGPDTDPEAIRSFGQSLRAWKVSRTELLNYTKQGSPFWAELDTAPVADEHGWFTHWISVQRDVSARKNAELEREQLIEELETRHAELSAYNQWVAHDLRNPVIAIRGIADLAELALEGNDPERTLRYIHRISSTAEQADRLIKSLMTIAKLGHTGTHYDSVQLLSAVQSVLSEFDYLIDSTGTLVELDLAAEIELQVDPTLLEVILRNLISNAIKHRHPHRPPLIQIHANCTAKPAGVEILVQDNGEGIDPSSHSRIFGLFERVSRDSDGVGLGLAMVDRAARLLLGRAKLAHSENDQGSCFSVWLPSYRPQRPAPGKA